MLWCVCRAWRSDEVARHRDDFFSHRQAQNAARPEYVSFCSHRYVLWLLQTRQIPDCWLYLIDCYCTTRTMFLTFADRRSCFLLSYSRTYACHLMSALQSVGYSIKQILLSDVNRCMAESYAKRDLLLLVGVMWNVFAVLVSTTVHHVPCWFVCTNCVKSLPSVIILSLLERVWSSLRGVAIQRTLFVEHGCLSTLRCTVSYYSWQNTG